MMHRDGVVVLFAMSLLLETNLAAKPRSSAAIYVVKEDAGKCRTDVAFSPLIYNDDKESASQKARSECSALHGRKYCHVESFRIVNGHPVPTSLVVIKAKDKCYDDTPRETFGFGVGVSETEAGTAAKRSLRQRNWNWSEKKQGFEQVLTSGLAWSAIPEGLACGDEFFKLRAEPILAVESGRLVAVKWHAANGNTVTTSISTLSEAEKKFRASAQGKKKRYFAGEIKDAPLQQTALTFANVALSFGGLATALCPCDKKQDDKKQDDKNSKCALFPEAKGAAGKKLFEALRKRLESIGPCAADKSGPECELEPSVDGKLGVRG